MDTKQRAPRNRTITLSETEREKYRPHLLRLSAEASISDLIDVVLNQDVFTALDFLPAHFVDLLFVDPPPTT